VNTRISLPKFLITSQSAPYTGVEPGTYFYNTNEVYMIAAAGGCYNIPISIMTSPLFNGYDGNGNGPTLTFTPYLLSYTTGGIYELNPIINLVHVSTRTHREVFELSAIWELSDL